MSRLLVSLLLIISITKVLMGYDSVTRQTEVGKLYVATFNRAPDKAGLDYWVNCGLTIAKIAQSFFVQPETQALYPLGTSNRDFIKSVYQNLFNRDPDIAGWDYWEKELNTSSISKNRFIEAVINGALDNEDGFDKTILNNKTEVGMFFVDAGMNNTDDARNIMKDITRDITSVTTAKGYITNNSIPSGFITGQNASLILSEAGFNNAGYLNTSGDGLLFNHLKGIDSDDTRLLVADGNNNRVLIWTTLPTSNNQSPDIVLGQFNLTSNNSGSGLNQMNWPTSVATYGGKVFVTDAYNDRVLVWNTFPTTSGQAADFAIANEHLKWPWGVWTDGNKLLVTSTMGSNENSGVFVWNSVPTSNLMHDYKITSNGEMGTPRTITTDGSSFLIVGDHNQNRAEITSGQGSFFWTSFPTSDSVADYFLQDYSSDFNYAWLQGDVTKDGNLFLLSRYLYQFNGIPTNANTAPTTTFSNYYFVGGDGADLVAADSNHDGSDDMLYISTYNGNKIVGFNSIPTSATAIPDFVLGSNDINVDALKAHHYIGNPTPATDGTRLFVASDFDRKLSVWNTFPTTDNQAPDFTISFSGDTLDAQPGSLTLHNSKLLVYAKNEKKLFIWNTLPTSSGSSSDINYINNIGSISLGNDVTFDDKYLYVIDNSKIEIWDISSGFPSNDSEPSMTLTLMSSQASKLSSDNNYLTITYTEHKKIELYKISDITTSGSSATPYATILNGGDLNLPESAITKGDKLFIADTVFNRVLVWDSIENAKNGMAPDTILGQSNTSDKNPKKSQDGLFWPKEMCFDGNNLWVGEYKFSGRLIRFNPE